MEKTLGARIAEKRKEKKMTQEELAEKLDVSSQAVSKWENDLSCPDIMLLPKLAEELGMTVDALLGNEKKPEVVLVPEQERKNMEDMMLRIAVNSADGDRVRVNLPMGIIKVVLESGMENAFGLSGKKGAIFQSIDFNAIFRMVENGMMGKLVEVESSDGDIVEITVE